MRQPILQRKDLVDLLLVLGDDDRGLGVIEHVGKFGSDRVLIYRDSDAAEAHRRELGEIEPRPVLADDRQLVARAEPGGAEAKREIAHFLPIASPTVRLPDAEILFAQ